MFPFEVRSLPHFIFSCPFSFFRRNNGTCLCFDLQNGFNMDGNYDFEECIGLKVKPRKGDGLLFYSLFPNGTIDAVSLTSLSNIFFSFYLTRKLCLS